MNNIHWKYKVIGCVFIAIAAMWILYGAVGRPLIKAGYEQKSFSLINNIFEEQSVHSLDFYLRQSDVIMQKFTLYGLILSLLIILPLGVLVSFVIFIVILLLLNTGFWVHDIYLNWKYTSQEDILWKHDDLLGWRYQSNASEYYSHKKSRTKSLCTINSKGLRDKEYSYEKPEGVRRIWLAGDSGVAGFGIRQDRTIDYELEDILSYYGKYEVLNGGHQGYGTDQSYLLLKEEGYKYHPDYIIYVWSRNDLEDNVSIHKPWRKFGKSYFTVGEDDNLVLQGAPVPVDFNPFDRWKMSDDRMQNFYNKNLEEQRKVRMSWEQGDIDLGINQNLFAELKKDGVKLRNFLFKTYLGRWIEAKIRKNEQLERFFVSRKWLMPDITLLPENKPEYVLDKQWEITKILIREMSRFADSIGSKFLVYEYFYNENLPEPTRLEKVCEELGVDYLNSFEKYKRALIKERMYHLPYDEHWNADGHGFAAEKLFEYLRETEWIKY